MCNVCRPLKDSLIAKDDSGMPQWMELVHRVGDARLGWRGLVHGDPRYDNFFFPSEDEVRMFRSFKSCILYSTSQLLCLN